MLREGHAQECQRKRTVPAELPSPCSFRLAVGTATLSSRHPWHPHIHHISAQPRFWGSLRSVPWLPAARAISASPPCSHASLPVARPTPAP